MRPFLFIVLTGCLLAPANAQFVQQGPKLVGTGGDGAAFQGQAVALSADGNTALVGGSDDSNNAGAAWVYARVEGVWVQQARLVGTGYVTGFGNIRQGSSVALSADGNTAMVGGPDDNSGAGAAWVFTRSGSTWIQQGPKLVGTDASTAAHQGASVALSADGNTALVGGPGDDSLMGAAWVFTRSGGAWTQQGPKLAGTGAAGSTVYQGDSVALSADGNTLLVGGPGDSSGAGAAWVFTRSGGAWTQQGSKLAAPGMSLQGDSVALSADGNTALVGTGVLGGVVYVRSASQWTRQGGNLIPGSGSGNSSSGLRGSVALSADGDTALVGGPAGRDIATGAQVFSRSGAVWTEQGPALVGIGGVGAARQGISVALSGDGNTAILGGTYDTGTAFGAGGAWVFTRPRMTVSAAPTASAGTPFPFTVTAQDAAGNPFPSYSGTLHFTSSDPAASLPADATLVNGQGTFSATLAAVGRNDITATDAGNALVAAASGSILVFHPAGCVFYLDAVTAGFADAGGPGRVRVSPSEAGCPWTVSSDSSWITVTSPISSSGGDSVLYNVAANAGGVTRTGHLTVAGQTFTITQVAGCTFTIDAASVSTPWQGQQVTVRLTASNPACPWSTYSAQNWVQAYPQSGIGSSSVTYTVNPSGNTGGRAAIVYIAGQALQITQDLNPLPEDSRFVNLMYFGFLGRPPTAEELSSQLGALAGGMTRTTLAMNLFNSDEFNSNGRFAAGVYTGILGRDPDYAGWLFQRAALRSGSISRLQLVADALSSPEYAPSPNDRFVRMLYANVLGRSPAPAELASQLETMQSGTSRAQVALSLLNGAEFRQNPGPRLTAFLQYASILSRDAEQWERDYWANLMATTMTVSQVFYDFVNSDELRIALH